MDLDPAAAALFRMLETPMLHVTIPPRHLGSVDSSEIRTECCMSPAVYERITSAVSFPRSPPVPPSVKPAYRLGRSPYGPSTGLAVFATRKIRAGEPILSERPLYIRRNRDSIFDSGSNNEQMTELLDNQIEASIKVSLDRMTEVESVKHLRKECTTGIWNHLSIVRLQGVTYIQVGVKGA